MNRTPFQILQVTLFTLLLHACAVGPDYKRPALSLPKQYIAGSLVTQHNTQTFAMQRDLPAKWWRLFRSEPLNELVDASINANQDLIAAKEALHSALELTYSAKGALLPFVGVSFNPTVQKTASILTSVLANNQYEYSLYTGQVYVSYMPDVFGQTRRQIESLAAQAEMQKALVAATYLSVTSNVVNAAIQEAALREQIKATEDIIRSQKELLSITQQQVHLGDAAILDVASQQTALAASESNLIPLRKQLAIQRDLLNALTGRFPDDPKTPSVHLNQIHLPHKLPLSVPSSLLEHRPDIRAAEEQMHAANALIGVAIANRLPNFTINSTNLGTAATTLGTLLQPDTRFWALAGIIAQPVFAGGTLKHKQGEAEATYRQTAAQYRSTIINAYQNVADTLKALQADTLAMDAAHHAEHAALTGYTIARHQVTLGDISSSSLLINQQAYQQARINLIQAQANQLSDTVALFQALGGGGGLTLN